MKFAFRVLCLTLAFLVSGSMAVRVALAQPAHAVDEGGAAGAHAGEHGSESPLAFNRDLAIWTALVFIALLIVLGKFAWGPISEGLDKREQRIAEHIAAAERSHEEAKAMLAQYEAKLSASQEEVRAILDEARRDAEHTQQEILAKARADASAEIERGKREIETATAQALKELAETSANLAVDLAGKVVQAHLNPADHARLITDALSRFPGKVEQN